MQTEMLLMIQELFIWSNTYNRVGDVYQENLDVKCVNKTDLREDDVDMPN